MIKKVNKREKRLHDYCSRFFLDQLTCEFTTSSTDTSATIYVWKYTTGTTYAYVFALTHKDDRAKSDSFESGFADWTHYPYEIPATSGTVSHNGSVSYKVDDDVTCKGLGVSIGTSTTRYCVRNGNNYTPTSVARSPGWHEFKFDYVSGDDLKILDVDTIQ